MFNKILIANRGEIACRVIRSAKKMGINTVAVYSEVDNNSLHVELADESVCIGPPASAQSYLSIDAMINACKQTGAQAVHPGYGFLSENSEFVTRLNADKICFIGPNTRAIEVMGDKITSKRLAENAGVNTIPGYTEVVIDANHALQVANEVGYPVMLKASAGGGGKGMRVIRNDAECTEGFERASSEAQSSFGDQRIFVERYIDDPRHIEIQVLADQHGSIVYLGERECSIQRRHQKIIEEAPSPFVNDDMRRAMGEQAVQLARAVDYCSAGTVEFIVDGSHNFYFLEMNTRLQVEHPITEMITGVDLVELMVRIAAGESLPFTQEEIRLDGWAIEARIYAEDPLRGFLPSTGRLVRYQHPRETETIRVDTGVYEGAEVSMYYDPMLAKLVARGDNRDQAIRNMGDALDAFYIGGLLHNVSFLQSIMAHPRFAEGRLSTNFIDQEYADGFMPLAVESRDLSILIATGSVTHYIEVRRNARNSNARVNSIWEVITQGSQHHLVVEGTGQSYELKIDGSVYSVDTDWRPGQDLFLGRVDGERVCVQIEDLGLRKRFTHRGQQAELLVLTHRVAELNQHMIEKSPPDLSKYLLSPMPGLLLEVPVKPGSTVKAGEVLAVVEAMKMENVLVAEQEGVVVAVLATAGDSVAVDQPIIEFE